MFRATRGEPSRYVTRSAVRDRRWWAGSPVRGRPWRVDGYRPFLRYAARLPCGSMKATSQGGGGTHRVGADKATERAGDLYVHRYRGLYEIGPDARRNIRRSARSTSHSVTHRV